MATKKASKFETLHDLFTLKLQSLYDVEQQIVKALPKMAKAATHMDLREALSAHLEESAIHVQRLEEIFAKLELPAKSSKVEAIRGLVKDADWLAKSIKSPTARDVALIAAAQYIEHYEMAGYGTALAWAEIIGHDEIAEMLEQTLDEESAADEKLTSIAEESVNDTVDTGMGEVLV